ncbi:hypothetical protein V8G54_013882 [Vigna mungo]|uniref:Uncharacterized protein n=1 Tax=Vigna mungo TaxID=3915 RepID=A0AAQ3NIH6_VIGMU
MENPNVVCGGGGGSTIVGVSPVCLCGDKFVLKIRELLRTEGNNFGVVLSTSEDDGCNHFKWCTDDGIEEMNECEKIRYFAVSGENVPLFRALTAPTPFKEIRVFFLAMRSSLGNSIARKQVERSKGFDLKEKAEKGEENARVFDLGKKRVVVLHARKRAKGHEENARVFDKSLVMLPPVNLVSHGAGFIGTPKTPRLDDSLSESKLESLPMKLLVKILCLLHHGQLITGTVDCPHTSPRGFLVCFVLTRTLSGKTFRKATEKQMHFGDMTSQTCKNSMGWVTFWEIFAESVRVRTKHTGKPLNSPCKLLGPHTPKAPRHGPRPPSCLKIFEMRQLYQGPYTNLWLLIEFSSMKMNFTKQLLRINFADAIVSSISFCSPPHTHVLCCVYSLERGWMSRLAALVPIQEVWRLLSCCDELNLSLVWEHFPYDKAASLGDSSVADDPHFDLTSGEDICDDGVEVAAAVAEMKCWMIY